MLRVITLCASLSFCVACEASDLSPQEKSVPAKAGAAATEITGIQSIDDNKALEELEGDSRNLILKGDLDAMLERGTIRVLVPYNKTFFSMMVRDHADWPMSSWRPSLKSFAKSKKVS